MILANGTTVKRRDLPPEVIAPPGAHDMGDSLDVAAHERELIRRALERFKGNRQQAAKALNISTVTLWRRMKHFGLMS